MIMNIDDFIQKMQSGELDTSSFDDLRNENLQKKSYGKKIPMLKKDRNTKSRILVFKSIAFPFNPFTVEGDAKYNENKKFRTEKSASSMMLAFKKFYNADAELKAKFMKSSKIDSWDTTDFAVINAEDRTAFSAFCVNTIFSINQVRINNKAVTGRDNGSDYKIDIKRDEIGKILYEYEDSEGNKVSLPKFVRRAISLGEFFSSCYLQEYKDWELSEGSNKTDSDKQTKKQSIMSQSPISDDRPKNFILGMKLPMKEKSLVLDVELMKTWETKDFAKCLVLIPYTKKIRIASELFLSDYKNRDLYADFYELDMLVPDIEDPKLRGTDTSFNNVETPIDSCDLKDLILNQVSNVLDEIEFLDKVVLASSYVEPLTNDIIEALTRNLSTSCDLEKLQLTDNIVERHGDLIQTIWAEKAAGILADAGMGELEEGTVTDSDRELVRKEMLAMQDDSDLEEVDLMSEE